jgi:hypothetical protein
VSVAQADGEWKRVESGKSIDVSVGEHFPLNLCSEQSSNTVEATHVL